MTTNVTEISLRPLTNALQRTEFNFKRIEELKEKKGMR